MKSFVFTVVILLSVHAGFAQSRDLDELRTLSDQARYDDANREKLIKLATKFIQKDSTVSEVFEIRAEAYEKSDTAKCVADYRKAVQLDSTNVNAHNGLGNILADLGQYDEALVHFELALHNGGYIGILLNIANLYEKTKNYEGWERTALRMTEPQMNGFNQQLGYLSLARLFQSRGEKEKAVVNYVKACEIGDPDGTYLVQTAMILIELNRKEEACKYLQRAKVAHDYQYGCCEQVPDLIKANCSE